MRASIVSVWYYIHRHDLQELFRSMLGVKFLICVPNPTTFEAVEESLRRHGDMFVWGTNFALKTEDTVDIISVPEGFVFPAGVQVVTPAQTDGGKASTRSSDGPFQSQLLRRSSKLDEPYYLFFMETPGRVHEGVRGTAPHFGGRRRAWPDSTIVEFMLKPRPPATAMAPICLPLSEQDLPPNLGRVLQVARDSGAIPVFEGTLPQGDNVIAVCDAVLDLPAGESDVWAAIKEHWLELLLSSSESPKPSLMKFRREIASLIQNGPIQRLTVRLYQLQYRIGAQELVHPAVVVNTR